MATALDSGASSDPLMQQAVNHDVVDAKYRYCIETVIQMAATSVSDARDKVLRRFTEFETDDIADSVVVVAAPSKAGGVLVKLHIHSNGPQLVFDAALQFQDTGVQKVLIKEKVEDMFEERAEMHGGAVYDMSKSKVTIVIDGSCLPAVESKHTTLMPLYIVPSSTGEPIMIDACDPNPIVTPIQLYNQLRLNPERVFTASPTPITAQLQLEKALRSLSSTSSEHVIVISISSVMAAYHRNIARARDSLSSEAQKKVTIFDTGYIIYEMACIARAALRAAEQGLGHQDVLARMEYVGARSFKCGIVSIETIEALHLTGRWNHVIGDVSRFVPGGFVAIGMHPPDAPTDIQVSGHASMSVVWKMPM
jgi:hypothetical protein